jgi:hypothetical protein
MAPPWSRPVNRRGFLGAMAATSAAVGAVVLSARGASAAAVPAVLLGSTAHTTIQRPDEAAHRASTIGENAMINQMTSAAEQDTAVRPFSIEVPQADLDDLRRRINATRWPERELVADASQGVQLTTTQKLARYWATDYNWRKMEARLNSLPNFITEIDGLDIHFIRVRSPHEDALPLIVTHGWPGSVIEQLKIVEPMTNPTA